MSETMTAPDFEREAREWVSADRAKVAEYLDGVGDWTDESRADSLAAAFRRMFEAGERAERTNLRDDSMLYSAGHADGGREAAGRCAERILVAGGAVCAIDPKHGGVTCHQEDVTICRAIQREYDLEGEG